MLTENISDNNLVISEAADLEIYLTKLVDNMRAQLSDLEENNYEDFIERSEKVNQCLDVLSNSQAPITPDSSAMIEVVQKLNLKIGLTLSARSDELSEQMKKVKSGKQVMKAYKNSVN